MLVPDVHILLFAHFDHFPDHEQWRDWLEAAIAGPEPVGLADSVLGGVVRIGMTASFAARPWTLDEALRAAATLLKAPSVERIAPGPQHWERMDQLLRAVRGGPKTVSDAYLAALAIDNDATVVTTDGVFGHFPGLEVFNPLTGKRSRR